ncbi:MAG: acyl-CoA thioesterase [Solirubrobacterales bacterium]
MRHDDWISFDEALAVKGGDRRYTAQVHPSWDGPLTTHGGLLAAIGLRAIDREINEAGKKQARAISCQYLRPPQHGEVEIDVDPLRVGRRFSSARATISQGGRPCIAVLATHSVRDLPEVTRWQASMPDVVAAPDRDAQRVRSADFSNSGEGWLAMPDEAPSFFHRLLIAPRFGGAPFMGPPADPAVGTENGGWVTLPDPRPIDPEFLVFMVDAFWPSVLQPLREPAMAPTLDLTIHLRSVLPREGLTDQPVLIHNTSSAVLDGISDSDSRIYAIDGTLLAQGRQLQLVAPLNV